MRIIGVGIDNIEISRFEDFEIKHRNVKHIFTEAELRYISAKPEHGRAQTTAGIFCAKEACVKALGKGIAKTPLNGFEILHDDNGAPYVRSDCSEVRFLISVSHSQTEAMAICIAEEVDDVCNSQNSAFDR